MNKFREAVYFCYKIDNKDEKNILRKSLIGIFNYVIAKNILRKELKISS